MRFVHLTVEGFQGIERAELAFGPSLNVLYGPNDLGKSTLAMAIRAALLMPPGSAEARHFVPWHKDEAPCVRLVFQDDSDQYWRVKKTFGDGVRSGAELGASKDGQDFTTEAKNREVDDRIRKLLRWGIPSPGGKSAPRGLPESFLAKALLAPQTEVDDILKQSLATDSDETGKLRLNEALSALAQHPKFKTVLMEAQGQVDQYFAPGGGKKRGKESPFAKADADVKKWTSELADLRRQEADSRATEDLVIELREKRTETVTRQADAADALDVVRKRFVRARVREEAAQRLEESRAALKAIDKRFEEVREAERHLGLLAEARAGATRKSEGAGRAFEQAEQDLRAAEGTHRRATSDEGAQERALRRAEVEKELADLRSREHELVATKARIERLLAARMECEAARAIYQQCTREVEAARSADRHAGEATKAAMQEHALSQVIVAYGRWRTAADAAESAANALRESEALRLRAAERDSEAAGLEDAMVGVLPTLEQIQAIRLLARELDRAEAALGGGMTITIRPKRPVSLTSTLDGTRLDRGTIDNPITLDAERSAQLAFADLVEVDVEAGAPEKRIAATIIRRRWETAGTPVLLRAGVMDLDQLERRVSDAEALRLKKSALSADARSLREQASHRERRAMELAGTAEQAAAREEALGGVDRAALKKAFEALGKNWEHEVEKVEAANRKAVDVALQKNNAAAQSLGTATYRYEDAEKQLEKLAAAVDEIQTSVKVVDAEASLAETTTFLAKIAAERTNLEQVRRAVEAEAGLLVSATEKALTASKKALEAAKSTQERAATDRDAARSAYDAWSGQCEALRSQVALLDRSAADALGVTRESEFARLPVEPSTTETDVAVAEGVFETAKSALGTVTEQLLTAEGGLQKVGGAVLRENLVRVKEALHAAEERESSLLLEAESWQLLRDVLREVENQEGKHLGRALAGPVTARLRDLTSSRYGDVQLGPTLQAQGIAGVSGAPPESVLAALSVGTKDQLATLLRIAIAQELRAAIILDDHLVHTDPERLGWFRKALREAAATTQVIVLTCRPADYLAADEMPTADGPTRHLAGGAVHALDLGRVVRKWDMPPEIATSRSTTA